MSIRFAFLAALAAAALPAPAAQDGPWPAKPVRMVVPFAPGGGTDVIARMIAPKLSQAFGQQFVVDNRGGAGGTIGSEIVVRAPADGYTIGLVASSYPAAAALYRLSYDPNRAIVPISMADEGPLILTITPTVRAADFQSFLALLRARTDGFSYGSSGIGSTLHLAGELFGQMTGTAALHVPYKGTGPAVVDLIGARIQFIFANGPSVLPHVKAGRLRPLAVTTLRRAPALPDLPAVHEFVPGYQAASWHGMVAPAGTPKAIVSRLNEALGQVLSDAKLAAVMEQQGLGPRHTTPEEFARVIRDDIARWTKVVRDGSIKLD